jgi:sensor histidine kinase YesM
MPIKLNIFTTKTVNGEKLNDIGFRVILIPFFGIAIPVITGMVPPAAFNAWEIKFSYLYTILISFVVWEGNRFLLFTLRAYFDWLNKPIKKIIALVIAVSFYTVPISILMLTAWYHIFMQGVINWQVVYDATLIILVCVAFIVHIYETVFLVKQAENDKLKKEQLERSRVEAELEALKNQVDPHFIFNSLNTLSHLIEERPVKAKQFNDSLADVYRYILQNKAKDLVLLSDEMQFMQDYFLLLKIRFEEAIQLTMKADANVFGNYLVPPISLQILLENAIKHNEFSDAKPLMITVEMKEETLMIQNETRKKTLRKPGSKIGLQNLAERYKLITGKEISILDEHNIFIVLLPLLKIE